MDVKLDLSPERPTVIMVFEKSGEVYMWILEEDGENFIMRRDDCFSFLNLHVGVVNSAN